MVSSFVVLALAAVAGVHASSESSSSESSHASSTPSSSSSAASSSSSSSSSSGEPLTIVTPSGLATCEPVSLSYKGGVPPYFLSVLPGGQPSGTPLLQWPETNETHQTWKVDLASGSSISIAIKDSAGTINYAATVTVAAGPDTSCVNSSIVDPVMSGSSSGSSSSAAPATSSSSSSSSSSDTSSDDTTGAAAQLVASGASILAGLAFAAFAL